MTPDNTQPQLTVYEVQGISTWNTGWPMHPKVIGLYRNKAEANAVATEKNKRSRDYSYVVKKRIVK